MTSRLASTESLDQLFKVGRFVDLLSALLPALERGSVSSEHRWLISRALLHAGDIERASRIAEDGIATETKELFRSRCELICGISAKRGGDLGLARRRIQHSIHLARQAGHFKQQAWSQLSLFRLLAEGEPAEILSAVLSETRAIVTKAGDPHSVAYLHDSVAMLEAQTGQLDEARRHLEIAGSIIDRYPNAWLEQVVSMSRLCLACLECDPRSASRHARRARELAKVTGGYGGDHTLDINEAYINLFTGRFAKAHASLQRVVVEGYGLAKFAALEALARLHFALNRLEDCESVLDKLSASAISPAIANCYSSRWAAATRAKLLMRRGAPEAAADCVRSEIVRARAVGDGPLVSTLTFLEADALAQSGHSEIASRSLFLAAARGATVCREYIGHYFDVCSKVVVQELPLLAQIQRSRAVRVWQTEGNIGAMIEFRSRTGPPLPIRDVTSERVADVDSVQPNNPVLGDATSQVLDSIASALDFAFDPRLAASELLDLGAITGCSRYVHVSQRTDSVGAHKVGPQFQNESAGVLLGSNSVGPVVLLVEPGNNARENIILSGILRVARAVKTLGKARAEERNRAALWPPEVLPEDDSLFLSPEMSALAATARKIAPTGIPVLITGETGTGKEILARAIHAASPRAKATFLPFNCSAGPRDTIDAQLFGHRRGAFTGATEHAAGVVRAAAAGTLFLDEIGEAPLDVQPKLLRVLESGEIHPVGEPLPVTVDVRVIAATNVDLDAAVASGRFREDLFYRLNIVRLHLPALRERRVEIPVFAQHYLRKHARELGKGNLRLAEETMEYLLLYKWPGNVRQLANEMRRLAALAEADAVLMPEHLSSDIVASRRTVPASERALESNELVVRLDQPLAAATEHLERAMIPYALRQSAGRVEEAARTLGLSRKGLYLKRMRLGLDAGDAQPRSA